MSECVFLDWLLDHQTLMIGMGSVCECVCVCVCVSVCGGGGLTQNAIIEAHQSWGGGSLSTHSIRGPHSVRGVLEGGLCGGGFAVVTEQPEQMSCDLSCTLVSALKLYSVLRGLN